MPDPYPLELRVRVVEAYLAGEGTLPELARRFSVGEATAKRWVWLQRKQGSVVPKPKGGGQVSSIALVVIEELLAGLKDGTAVELTVVYNRRNRRRPVHVSSMKRALRRHGYVIKKNAAGRWSVCVPTSPHDGKPT